MDCLFCKIISGDIPSKFLRQTRHSVSFLDAFPLAKAHALVLPKKHHKKLQDMSDAETSDLFLLVKQMTSKIDSLYGDTLIAMHNGKDAGQEIPHVHVHIVPRIPGDSAGPIHGMFEPTLKLSESETEKIVTKLKA